MRAESEPQEKEPSAPSAPAEPAFGKVIQMKEPPRRYGFWQCREGPTTGNPKALIIFSGRSREGDLSHCLARLGWVVCAIDTITVVPTDILDDAVWDDISADLQSGFYDGLWIATPCGTFSPLREKPPGPRPLRSLERIEGLPHADLTASEVTILKEANILVKRTYTAAAYQNRNKKPWGIENPKHPKEKPQLWYMPLIKNLAKLRAVEEIDFDQCRTGLDTTKPTRLLVKRLNLDELKGLRCNHEVQTFKKPDGTEYRSAHESTVQRWVEGPKGRERASKSQGEYTEELCKVLARAFHATADPQWLKGELQMEPL